MSRNDTARIIGSRGSDLALWQSRTVLKALRAAAAGPAWHSDITVVTTSGDVDPSPYLAGGVQRGFFTKELEVALLERQIDLVVHSLKDLPTAPPAGLVNRTILPRASAADWLLVREEFYEPQGGGALPLRKGTRVGASSLRRGALLGHFAPQAVSVPLRGNVPTRVRKLAEGASADAIILAAAGLSRLAIDLTAFHLIELSPELWPTAPGQGALAAQCRAGESEIESHVALLSDAACAAATRWEREFLRVIEGGCSTPFGCHVVGNRAFLGIASERGWLANSIELPQDLEEGPHRDAFIRAAVAGCRYIALQSTAGTLGRAVRAR